MANAFRHHTLGHDMNYIHCANPDNPEEVQMLKCWLVDSIASCPFLSSKRIKSDKL